MRTLLPILLLAACHAPPKDLALDTLLRRDLAPELAAGREVVVSSVELPPHTMLPWHWHPGEEFVYLLDGEVTAHFRDGTKTLRAPGAVGYVPLKAVHTASTGAAGARLIVFRVHTKGEPERHVVEDPRAHPEAPAAHEHEAAPGDR